jgi:hypothetical protein
MEGIIMKPILTKEENVNLYLKNFMQLGEALMNAGGNSFSILKRYDDFLRTLAANNIEVTAKYNSPEDDLQKLVKEDPMWQKPLANNVQEDYDDSLEYVAYYRSSDGAVFRRMIGTNKFRNDQVNPFKSTVYTVDDIRTFVNSGSMVGISKTYHKES